MGNLYQENRFSTSGDGLAQWNSQRLEQLKQRGGYQDLTVQLDYLMYELDSYESKVNTMIKQSDSLEDIVLVFQNGFERCNPEYCMQNQRIQYAYEILDRNK